MDGKKMKKLEELVGVVIKELRKLRSQNEALREDLDRRKADLNNTLVNSDQLKKQQVHISELEKKNKQLESDQTKVRKKVVNILDELEKADFI